MNDLLTVAEAAGELKVSPGTVYALCKAGKLEHFRIGLGRGTVRIHKKALSALLREGQKQTSSTPVVSLQDLYSLVGRLPPQGSAASARPCALSAGKSS